MTKKMFSEARVAGDDEAARRVPRRLRTLALAISVVLVGAFGSTDAAFALEASAAPGAHAASASSERADALGIARIGLGTAYSARHAAHPARHGHTRPSGLAHRRIPEA
jgi:hypothetical protein